MSRLEMNSSQLVGLHRELHTAKHTRGSHANEISLFHSASVEVVGSCYHTVVSVFVPFVMTFSHVGHLKTFSCTTPLLLG